MRKNNRGFTLIELMITLSIMAFISLIALQELRNKAEDSMSKTAAIQMDMLGDALTQYISDPANTATISAAATTAVTTADLIASGNLPAGFVATNAWGGAYTMRIRRIGGSAPYTYEALITTGAYVDSGNTRLDIVGRAVEYMEGTGGMTYDATAAVGRKGTWSAAVADYPGITASGQLAYLVSPASAINLDGTYLRVDGGNAMTGALNVGGNNINNAADVTSTGALSSASLATGNIASSGSVNAASISSAGSVNAATISSTGALSGGSVATTGALTVGGNTTIAGSVSATNATIANDINLQSLTAYGHSSTSMRDHTSRYMIIETDTMGDGDTKIKPTCPVGGSPGIYIMMRSALVPNGQLPDQFAGTEAVANDNGTSWTLSMKDAYGNSLTRPENPALKQTALVWISCTF